MKKRLLSLCFALASLMAVAEVELVLDMEEAWVCRHAAESIRRINEKSSTVRTIIAPSFGQLKGDSLDERTRKQILFVADKLAIQNIFRAETNAIPASCVINGATHFIVQTPPNDSVVFIDACGNISVKGSDGMVLASGMRFEAEEAPNVRAALIGELVKGAVPLESVADSLHLSSDGIGEFALEESACVHADSHRRKRVLHFIRMGNVISLYAEEGVDDIRPIAKALDDFILKQAAMTNALNAVSTNMSFSSNSF